ncbi:hypothetical protein ACOMHN_022124 [Nucella lapillus]
MKAQQALGLKPTKKETEEMIREVDKNMLELMKAQQALGLNPTKKEIEEMIREVDDNKSGFIELTEYITLMSERVGVLEYEQQQLEAAFRHFDKDGSGKLSRDELRRFLTSNFGDPLTEEEFNDVINDMDKDGDGLVDVGEFSAMLCHQIGT